MKNITPHQLFVCTLLFALEKGMVGSGMASSRALGSGWFDNSPPSGTQTLP